MCYIKPIISLLLVALSFQSLFLFKLVEIECATTGPNHAYHGHHHNKEREGDGAFSPKDHLHYENGDHHSDFDHEAILGSTKEAEEFDHLPPEESKRRLEILLTKMDRNTDKEIDRVELYSWIIRSFKKLSAEESQEKLEDADENEDGMVTWDEYIKETFGLDSDEADPDNSQSEEDSEEEKRLMAADKILFDSADRNKDGTLNKEEFLAFSHPEENAEMAPVVVKQTLKERDINGDGFIDFQEYIGDRGKRHDKEWLLVEKEKFDNDHDKDRNGRLDYQEILAWMVPSNEEIAEDEVDHLFSSSDDNHDDKLSFDEIIDHYDIFVGSEATDYGDHLQNINRFDDEL